MIKDNVSAKFTLFPVTLVKNNGLKSSELKLVESVIEENQEIIEKIRAIGRELMAVPA